MSLDPFKKSTRKRAPKPAHHQLTSIFLPSLFVAQHFLSGGWESTSSSKNISAMGGTIVLDSQSGSCVHCQLFPPHTHTQPRPRCPAVLRGGPQPAARDSADGSQPWLVPPRAKLGQLARTPRAFLASHFSENIALRFFRLPSPPLSDFADLRDSLITPLERAGSWLIDESCRCGD